MNPQREPAASTTQADDGLGDRLAKLARVLTGDPELQVRISRDGPAIVSGALVAPVAAANQALAGDELAGWVDLLSARMRFGDVAALDHLASPVTRALAEAIDDRRAADALIAAFPGAARLLARQRDAAARDVAHRWPGLRWRERFVWRVARSLWHESPTLDERIASLDAALVATSELIDAARAAHSTADSIVAAERIVERVRALARGDTNNLMFTVDRETTLDPQSAAADIDPDGDFAAHDPNPPAAGLPLSSAATLADTASSADDAASGDAAASPRAARDAAARRVLSIPITTEFDTVTDLTGQGDPTGWRKLRSAARAQTSRLKAQLERALEADEQIHWRTEQERGELDRRALARVATSPGYRTPFRVKKVRSGRGTAVTLLIDRSGSMAGRKIELARLCAAALCDALAQLGFACEALGYSSVDDPRMRAYRDRWLAGGGTPRGYNRFVERLDLEIYKRFDSDNLSGLARIDCGHENPDGEALTWAADRLLARRAHRRILMVLSDGYPATGDGNPAVLRADLRTRIAELVTRGVELIGVGILDDAVETFYPTSTIVERLPELPAVAFETLGKALLS